MREQLTDTYEDVRTLLDDITRVHYCKYGGNYDDLRANANSLFVEAFDSYDESKGTFFNWIKFYVWKQLLYARRSQLRESSRYVDQNLEETLEKSEPSYFDLEDFIGGISQDAGFVVRLALRPPRQVLQGVGLQGGPRQQGGCPKARGNKGGARPKDPENKGVGRPKTMGAALRRYLSDLGWATRRIASTFQEIREAL